MDALGTAPPALFFCHFVRITYFSASISSILGTKRLWPAPLKGEESLFDRDGLYQIPWFIRVEPPDNCRVIGQLSRNVPQQFIVQVFTNHTTDATRAKQLGVFKIFKWHKR